MQQALRPRHTLAITQRSKERAQTEKANLITATVIICSPVRYSYCPPSPPPSPSSYVPFPCILSSKECECERAAPLMLIPSETSGKLAEGGPWCRGESERCDWSSCEDLDFDVFRLPVAGERRRGCPMRNSNDGVSSSVAVFNRFIVED